MQRTPTAVDMYVFTDPTWSSVDLSGFSVEATDGGIGSVDSTTYEIGTDSLIVDTGPWIFGKKVMLPAGVVARIDENDRRVWVNLTKDQIQHAPEFDESKWRDSTYRDELGTYYSSNRPGGPDYAKDDRSFNS
jgi:hypothetical protein